MKLLPLKFMPNGNTSFIDLLLFRWQLIINNYSFLPNVSLLANANLSKIKKNYILLESTFQLEEKYFFSNVTILTKAGFYPNLPFIIPFF